MNTYRFVRQPIENYNYLKTEAFLIWHPLQRETYYDIPKNSYCRFRKKFALEREISSAQLKIFASDKYMLFINGKYINKGPARSNPAYQFYDEIDIKPYLSQGENIIAVMALFYGYGTGHSMNHVPALFADGEINTADGKTVFIRSDSSWVCSIEKAFDTAAPRVNGCKGPCEIFDNRLYDADWISCGYDDSSWSSCHSRQVNHLSPFFNLLKRPIPLLMEKCCEAAGVTAVGTGKEAAFTDISHLHIPLKKECSEMELYEAPVSTLPQSFMPHGSGEYSVMCIDFGKITAGYLNLQISGKDGDICDIVFSEILTPNKRPYFDGISYRPLSRFILKDGQNRLQVFFNYDAMRYAYLIYRGKSACVERAWISEVYYPLERKSIFRTDDKKLQKLWDYSLNSMRLCTQDAFVDSPSREQQQWMGDARFTGIYNAYLSGDMRIIKKILYQFAQSQDYEGMTCSRYPDENINLAPIPSYCLQWIGAFRDYYDFTGDLTPVKDLYCHMIRAMRWFTAFQKEDGLIWNNPYWEFYDTGVNSEGKSGDFFGSCAVGTDNLMLLEASGIMARFGELMGDAEAAGFYTDFHKKLAKAIDKYFWSEEKGCLVDSVRENHKKSDSVSEIVNILALLHLYEPGSEKAEAITDKIFNPENAPENTVHLSVYAMLLYIRGLMKHKKYNEVYRRTLDKFSEMLEGKNCTQTIWEHWKLFSIDKNGNACGICSACHAWGACGILLAAELLCGVSYCEGRPVLKSFPEKPDTGDFEAVLELPGRDLSHGYRLFCSSKNGVLSRKLIEI